MRDDLSVVNDPAGKPEIQVTRCIDATDSRQTRCRFGVEIKIEIHALIVLYTRASDTYI